MVGGEDDRAARAASLVENLAQVRDLVDGPVGRAGLALVQGVVDRVEDDADHGVGLGDLLADLPGEGTARLGGKVGLVEEGGLAPAPEGGEASALFGLAAGPEGAGQQAGPGDRGDRRDGGEHGFTAVLTAASLKPAATAGELARRVRCPRRRSCRRARQ